MALTSGNTRNFFFLWRGFEGAKIPKFAENGWFWQFFFFEVAGGGAKPLMGRGNVPPLMLPLTLTSFVNLFVSYPPDQRVVCLWLWAGWQTPAQHPWWSLGRSPVNNNNVNKMSSKQQKKQFLFYETHDRSCFIILDVVRGCFMIRVHNQSHLRWKTMCFWYVWY